MLPDGRTNRWKQVMDLLTQYWEQLSAFVFLVVILTRMRVDIEVLKDKVKVLFDLINRKGEK